MLAHNSISWFDKMWMLKANFHQINQEGRNRVINILHWIKTYPHWIQWGLKGSWIAVLYIYKHFFLGEEKQATHLPFSFCEGSSTAHICNIYTVTLYWPEGQAGVRSGAPSVPDSNPFRWTQCTIHFCHLPHSFPIFPLLTIQIDPTLTRVVQGNCPDSQLYGNYTQR